MRRSLRPRYWRSPTADRARCSICAGAIPEMARSPCWIRRLAPLGACRPSREGLDRAAVRCIRSRTVPVAALDRGAGIPASPRLGAWFAMTRNSADSPASSAFGSQSRRHVGREPALDRQAARDRRHSTTKGYAHTCQCAPRRDRRRSRVHHHRGDGYPHCTIASTAPRSPQVRPLDSRPIPIPLAM